MSYKSVSQTILANTRKQTALCHDHKIVALLISHSWCKGQHSQDVLLAVLRFAPGMSRVKEEANRLQNNLYMWMKVCNVQWVFLPFLPEELNLSKRGSRVITRNGHSVRCDSALYNVVDISNFILMSNGQKIVLYIAVQKIVVICFLCDEHYLLYIQSTIMYAPFCCLRVDNGLS